MHDIEPHHHWRDRYVSAEDSRSPHYGRTYDEFRFTKRVYNYYIHPQWDEFGSSTLYIKILYVDYELRTAILELIGEWNDCLSNDILFLKQNVVDNLVQEGISRYILILDNVLNFHGSDNCYYEEWFEDLADTDGFICFLNTLPHVQDEMCDTQIDHFVTLGAGMQIPNWRSFEPRNLAKQVEANRSVTTHSLP